MNKKEREQSDRLATDILHYVIDYKDDIKWYPESIDNHMDVLKGKILSKIEDYRDNVLEEEESK